MQHVTEDSQRVGLPEHPPRFPEPLLSGQMELRAFTTAIFEPTDLVELRLIESWVQAGKKRSRLIERLWLQASEIPGALPRLQELNALGANIYFGVNPRTERSGRKDGIAVIRSIWMDMDSVQYDEARARWTPYLPAAPSIVVQSGHGVHLYYLLRSPFVIQSDTQRECFERMLRAIYRATGCDAVQDVCRVLRLPGGLWNVKSLRNGIPPVPCELLECDPQRTYPFRAFARWWERAKEEIAVEAAATRAPPASTAPLGDPRTKELVAELDRSVSDRSRRDFAVVLALLRLGLSPEEIWPLVENRSKFEFRGRPYFDITVRNALRVLERGVSR